MVDRNKRLSFLRASATALLVVYVAWNIAWLVQLRIPPSLFSTLVGLPCATTGGTRSFLALCAGDWAGSLRWNPMTIPILVLYLVSLGHLVQALRRRGRLVLPKWCPPAWCAVLGLAWAIKLIVVVANT